MGHNQGCERLFLSHAIARVSDEEDTHRMALAETCILIANLLTHLADDVQSVAVALAAPAMGSKHSMEIAQATHHGIMHHAKVIGHSSWMAWGWAPPSGPLWMGCYCDGLALIAVLDKKIGMSLSEAKHLDDLAEAGYEKSRFIVKREKCETGLDEGTICGARLSSSRRDLRCPPEKFAAIDRVTPMAVHRRGL
eukprot:1118556-Amphidinium_carterae.3